MEVKTKQRIVGILVLVAILAIFLPVLFHTSQPSTEARLTVKIPAKPAEPQIALREKVKPAVTPVASAPIAIPTPTSAPVAANKKIMVDAPEAWVVQLGSFSDKSNAERLIKKLREKGFEAYSRADTTTKGAPLNRVYVGPEIHLSTAKQLLKKLHHSFHLNGVVRKYKI